MSTAALHVDSIVCELLYWSIKAAAIVVVGECLIRLLYRSSASFRHSIWLAVSVCILIAPALTHCVPGMLPRTLTRTEATTSWITSDVSSEESGELSSKTSAIVSSPELRASIENTERIEDGQKRIRARAVFGEQDRTGSSPNATSGGPLSVYWVLMAWWIIGMAIYIVRVWLARYQLRQLFDQGLPTPDDSSGELISKIAAENGMIIAGSQAQREAPRGIAKQVAIVVTDCETGPLVWGVCPARILLPNSIFKLPRDAQEAALRHEFAHVLRGDEWVRRYLVVLRAVFWFHPLVRYCCNQVQLLAEKACDDEVLRMGHKPSDYSALLLELGRKLNGMQHTFALSGMAQSQLSIRIESILNHGIARQPITRRALMGVMFTMLLAAIAVSALRPTTVADGANKTLAAQEETAKDPAQTAELGTKDWPQWGGSSTRNNVTLHDRSLSTGTSRRERTSAGRCRWVPKFMAASSWLTVKCLPEQTMPQVTFRGFPTR